MVKTYHLINYIMFDNTCCSRFIRHDELDVSTPHVGAIDLLTVARLQLRVHLSMWSESEFWRCMQKQPAVPPLLMMLLACIMGQ